MQVYNQTNKDTYEEIAEQFSETRAYVWQCVKDFTILIKDNSNILEIGCGNGKNMEYILKTNSVNLIGIDTCKKFVDICSREKKLNVILGDALKLDFEDSKFDYVLCIAMFHHLLTEEEQDISFKEMLRVMKNGAIGILTCWATEQPFESKFKFTEGVNIVPWKGKDDTKTRYYYVYNEEMFLHFFMKYEQITIIKIYNEVGNWILLFKKKFIT